MSNPIPHKTDVPTDAPLDAQCPSSTLPSSSMDGLPSNLRRRLVFAQVLIAQLEARLPDGLDDTLPALNVVIDSLSDADLAHAARVGFSRAAAIAAYKADRVRWREMRARLAVDVAKPAFRNLPLVERIKALQRLRLETRLQRVENALPGSPDLVDLLAGDTP